MLSYQKTVSARHVGGMNIEVVFADGSKGLFDFGPYLSYMCYAPLKNPKIFSAVRADHGTLMWPGNIDISPETVWTACSGHG